MEQFPAVKRTKDGQPIQYLIVDDSVFARKNLGRIIESFGGQVAGEAGDGLTAITEYDRLKPDIVLMDITMPQMEGIGGGKDRAERPGCPGRHGLLGGVSGEHRGGLAARGSALRAEAGQARSAVRGH